MPYLDTPQWAKYVLNTLYTLNYLLVIAVGTILILPPPSPLGPIVEVTEGIMILAAIVAIYGTWTRQTHWEWSASLFILGGMSAYVMFRWIFYVRELLGTGMLDNNNLTAAVVGSMAWVLLSSRSVLLYIAVQKNKALSNIKR